jgi:5-methylcytosine-specific restriction endonuclease McrA
MGREPVPSRQVYCKDRGQPWTYTGTSLTPSRRCWPCRKAPRTVTTDEASRVVHHIRLAQQIGRPATLTVEEWLAAIRYFQGLCAYCQVAPFTLLEHFVPLVEGGGTTADNCVPACYGCNVRKQQRVNTVPRDVLDRVRSYLAQEADLAAFIELKT